MAAVAPFLGPINPLGRTAGDLSRPACFPRRRRRKKEGCGHSEASGEPGSAALSAAALSALSEADFIDPKENRFDS